MKMTCACGALMVDATDRLPDKARLIPDQRYEALMVRIEALIESRPSTPSTLESTLNELWQLVRTDSRNALQCHACGRLHVQDEHFAFHSFGPEAPDAGGMFRRDRDAG